MAELCSLGWLFLDFEAGNFLVPAVKPPFENEYFTMTFTQIDRKGTFYKEKVRFVYNLEATGNLSPLLSDLK